MCAFDTSNPSGCILLCAFPRHGTMLDCREPAAPTRTRRLGLDRMRHDG